MCINWDYLHTVQPRLKRHELDADIDLRSEISSANIRFVCASKQLHCSTSDGVIHLNVKKLLVKLIINLFYILGLDLTFSLEKKNLLLRRSLTTDDLCGPSFHLDLIHNVVWASAGFLRGLRRVPPEQCSSASLEQLRSILASCEPDVVADNCYDKALCQSLRRFQRQDLPSWSSGPSNAGNTGSIPTWRTTC